MRGTMHRGYDAYESNWGHATYRPYTIPPHAPYSPHITFLRTSNWLKCKKVTTHNVCILFPMHHIQEYDVWAISHVGNTMHGEYDVWGNMMHASTMWFIGNVWDHYDALDI